MLGHYALGEQALGGPTPRPANELGASFGLFTFAGQDVTLYRSIINPFEVDAGTFTLTGQDVDLLVAARRMRVGLRAAQSTVRTSNRRTGTAIRMANRRSGTTVRAR